MDTFQNSQTLGPYRIISELGRGGMSIVFKAYHPTMDRYVAIKVLIHQYANDEGFRGRFRQEVRLLSKLEHPHILAVYDCGETPSKTPEGIPENVPYLVMRYLEGGTLKEYLETQMHPPTSASPQKTAGLALDVVDQFFSQLADALQYAHEQGIIHRDVKPGNIMVDKRGNVYLTDFGIAKLMEGSLQLTPTGAITGTPAYMSPEQAEGEKLDCRTDIYSVGIVLYELLTGRVPYEAQTPVTALQKKLTEPLPSPRAFNANISPLMEAVVYKALAKPRGDRFSSMQEFLVAWKQALSAKAGDDLESATQILKPAPPQEELESYRPDVQQPAASRVLTAAPQRIEATHPQTPPEPQQSPAWSAPVHQSSSPPLQEGRPKTPWWGWLLGLIVFLCVVAVGVGGIFVTNTFFSGKGKTTITPLAQVQPSATPMVILPTATATLPPGTIQSIGTLRALMTLESSGTAQPQVTPVEDTTQLTPQTTPPMDVLGGGEPTATTPAVQAGGETLLFGPKNGSWDHIANTEVQLFSSSSKEANFSAQVTFSVPYTTTIGTWDSGFIFRTTGNKDGYGLVIRGGGQNKNTWELIDCSKIDCRIGKFTEKDTKNATLERGVVNSLDTTTGKTNKVILIVWDDLGILFVNNFFCGHFDLSQTRNTGDIIIGTAFYKESDKVEGSYPTTYKDFQVWKIPLVYGPSEGQLKHGEDKQLITKTTGVDVKNFIAKATFSVPYMSAKGIWNVGFVFRSQADNDQFRLLAQSDSLWKFGNKVSNQTYTSWLSENKPSYLKLGPQDTNTLLLIALNEKSLFFVNGNLVAKPDLTVRSSSGDFGVGIGFLGNDQIAGFSTDFTDFSIWELP